MSTDGKITWKPTKKGSKAKKVKIIVSGPLSPERWADFENRFKKLARDDFGLTVTFDPNSK